MFQVGFRNFVVSELAEISLPAKLRSSFKVFENISALRIFYSFKLFPALRSETFNQAPT